jgi:DNA replication protein DnaC
MCECGEEERLAKYVGVFGIWVHTKWGPKCEAKEKIKDNRNQRLEKRDKMHRMIQRAIPELFHEAHLFQVPKDVKDYLKTKAGGQGIFFWGMPGRGKTHIACAIMRNFIVRGKRAQRERFKDIVDKIQDTFSKHTSAEMVYQRYINADLLCIEDLGTGKSDTMQTDFNQDVLLKIIDRRIEAKKTTIITSNLSPDSIRDAFGSRVGGRLRTFLTIEITGRDRRKDTK